MLWKRRTQEDFVDEIRSHLAHETDRLIAEGLSPEEARRAAQRRFGNVTVAQERFYQARRPLWFDHLQQDARVAARNLAKYPVACAVAVISLAAGIGATTATLIVRDVVFHRPPALYRDPEQLSRVQVGTPDRPIRPGTSLVSGVLYAAWRDTISDGVLAASTPARMQDVRTRDRTDSVRVRSVTSEFFSVLGVDATLGRTFSTFSDSPAQVVGRDLDAMPTAITAPPIVLSHRLWQTLFDGRPDALGATIWLDALPHLVIGVMPERFWFSSMDSPLWTMLDTNALLAEPRLEVVVRRQDGVTPVVLTQQLQIGVTQHAGTLPADQRQLQVKVSSIEGTPVGNAVSIALPWMLSVCVLLTLLIACANVAILVIAQWTRREHEMAIRTSLGASRSRIVRLLLTESFLIAAAGGVFGILATFGLRGLIVHQAGDAVRFFDLTVDPGILVEAALLTFLAGAIAGIGPALLETRRLHGNPMRTLSSSDRVRQRWRHALVVMEIAVTIALLVVTGGMIGIYQRSLFADVGYRTEPLLMMRVENSSGVPIARVLDALEQMPGVADAAASTSVPYLGVGSLERVSTDAAASLAVRAERVMISPEFFGTLDVHLRNGRAFTQQDSSATRTAIVNESLATRLFLGRDPIGQRVWMADTPYEIVGLVSNYTTTAFQNHDRDPKLFLPLDLGARGDRQMSFLVRATDDPVTILRSLRAEVHEAAAGNIVTSAFTLRQIMAIAGQEILVGTAPLVPLIGTGMLLTAAGIYGVLAFAITRRSKELALRVAVGASGRDLVCLVSAHSLRLVCIGTVCGIGSTFALSRVVRASGGGGSMLDPPWQAFAIPVLIVFVIAALATWIPSRRALKIDPALQLRSS